MTTKEQAEVRRYRVHATKDMDVPSAMVDVYLASDYAALKAHFDQACELLAIKTTRIHQIADERDALAASEQRLAEALTCATCLHIDEPGREGPALAPLRELGWNPATETGQQFVARLARAALAARKGEA